MKNKIHGNKGKTAWNKGLTKETNESVKRISEAKLKEKNPMWKGNNAKSRALRSWIKGNLYKPNQCENCNQEKKLDLSFDHSKKNHTRNIEDYKWLCRSCHMKRDSKPFTEEHKKKISLALKGQTHWKNRKRNEYGQFVGGE